MLKVFGYDDYIMVIAMAFAVGTFACFVIESHYGLGKHLMVVLTTPGMYEMLAKLLFFHSIIVMIAVSCVKISIAVFLLRLSTRTPYKRFLYTIIVFLILFTITCMMTLILQCIPVQAAWDTTLRPPPLGTGTAKCYSLAIFRDIGLFNSSINIATDVLFATLPIPLVWNLQLNQRTKISLIAILSLGYFACAAAIIKAIQQWHVLSDPDWTVHDSFNVWNFIELSVGIIAASLPALKPLFNWCLETARAITSGSGNRSKRSGYGYKRNSSLGYLKADEASSRSVALESIQSRMNNPTGGKSPYHVRVTCESVDLTTRGIRKDEHGGKWDMEGAKKSDDSILPLQRPPVGHEIVRTTEVHVS